ncbi:MAG: two-component system response regulator FlrC [Candidatus Endobugula sp.]|jgi:two-component system response regulator FlrC
MSALLSEMMLHDSQKLHKKVLVVEDDYALREALEDTLALANYSVVSAKDVEQAITILSQDKEILMIVSDINMGELSGHDLLKYTSQHCVHIPVLLMTAFGSVRDSVDAIRNGAVDYLVKPFEPKELVDIVDRQLGCAVVNNEEMPIAEDEHSQQLLQLSQRVAQSNSTVLIVGESGTGKEVLARYIHQQSTRSKQVFIAINCAAIPENMLEAMLFGYEKGAYTGAQVSTPGKFEQANGGTLLLDEISEMDIGLQAKLLRVLQEREVERLGGRKTIALDVRVIATSNRDILKAVAEGKFREDLYYRLSVLPLVWKPLRERTKDILPLASLLLNKHSGKQKRRGLILSDSAQQALLYYPWPGNVRELDNVIQRALILQMGNVIEENDLGLNTLALSEKNIAPEVDVTSIDLPYVDPSHDNLSSAHTLTSTFHSAVGSVHSAVGSVHSAVGTIQESSQQLGDNLQKREFEIIANTLREERGSRKNTADRLGISPRTLRYKLAKMREMGLDA